MFEEVGEAIIESFYRFRWWRRFFFAVTWVLFVALGWMGFRGTLIWLGIFAVFEVLAYVWPPKA